MVINFFGVDEQCLYFIIRKIFRKGDGVAGGIAKLWRGLVIKNLLNGLGKRSIKYQINSNVKNYKS